MISYGELLEIFFVSHTATRPRIIRQYESAIFYHDETQKTLALQAMGREEERLGQKVTTRLLPFDGFTRAEDYHQKYYLRSRRDFEKYYESIYPDPDLFTDSTAAARVNGYLGGYGTLEQFEREAPDLGLTEGLLQVLQKMIRKKG